MEFTVELSSFQGVLISVDNVYSFTKVTAKGGNEEKIEYIIDSIRSFLMQHEYINDKGSDQNEMLRLFAFYIILNADLPVLEELVDMEGLATVIWTVPTIANCLMCEMLWNFSMANYVYEIITFSYPELSIELADALLYNMKYLSPKESLQPLRMLSSACYKLICRLSFFNIVDTQVQFAFINFRRSIKYLIHLPNTEKLESLQKDDFYKFLGKHMQTILSMIQECFNEYNNTQNFKLDSSLDIYTYTYKEGCVNDSTEYKTSQCTNMLIKECLDNCHKELLDKCKEFVMNITVFIFCAWSEFEERGVNMQQNIGELAYSVRKTLLESNVSEHPLVEMLEQISCKPSNIREDINTTDSVVIIKNILENNNDNKQWVQALVHRDKLCEDAALINLLDSHIEMLNEDDCYTLFKKLYNNVSTCSENMELIQSLIIKAYQCVENEVKHDILEDHFKDGFFNNTMETPQFNHMLTVIFNKLAVTPEPDLSDILCLFIQNPRQVYDKIFNFALHNNYQTQIMLKVLTFLEEFTNHVYREDTESCLIIELKNTLHNQLTTEMKQSSFINLVCELKEINILPGTKLLLLIIMPSLHKAIIDRSYKMMGILVRLLYKSFSTAEMMEYRAPMIAMLAQVMDRVRWKIDTYDVSAPSTLHLVTKLQISLMSTHQQMPDYEIYWLKNKVKGIDPLNMYYFRQLWNPPGNTYLEVISGVKIHINMDLQQLTVWLAQILCSSISAEWKMIWESLVIFGRDHTLDLFHNALLSMLAAEKHNRTEVTWECVLHCYKNFVQSIRHKFLKVPLHDSQVSSVTSKLIEITDIITEDKIQEFGTIIIPLFAFIAERKDDYTDDMWQRLQNKLRHEKLGSIVSYLFSNGCNE